MLLRWQVESTATLLESLLLGTNWMEDTLLFYGHYYGTFVFEFGGVDFDFPLAYLLVFMAVFVVNLVAIVVSSAKSFRVGSHRARPLTARTIRLILELK